jgi:3-oxoacyl-(acyl-carrier-protein) synthase
MTGTMLIKPISEALKEQMLDKNLVRVIKNADGAVIKQAISKDTKHVSLYASIDNFNMDKYQIKKSIVDAMDKGVQIAVACGLEALINSGIYVDNNPNDWTLPLELQNRTGIIYVTAFPALETTIYEVSKYFSTKMLHNLDVKTILSELKNRIEIRSGTISNDIKHVFGEIEELFYESADNLETYEFDKKFLLKILLLANSQLAQIIKAKGPNIQTNTACTGTTQAISIACDMIQTNKADRIIVIASDVASSNTLMPWIGNGFQILGAACLKNNINEACFPFNEKRSGMILSSGGVGIVVEKKNVVQNMSNIKCAILGTLISNSASHGTSMDHNHMAETFESFIKNMEHKYSITRSDIAKNGVYLSHETSTNASTLSSCAYNEIYMLRHVFGEELKNLLILNTKGFTGHAMSVSFEDVVAVDVLTNNRVPPIANYTKIDQKLCADDLKMSMGGEYKCKYALKFAAGFGSQIAFILYGVI